MLRWNLLVGKRNIRGSCRSIADGICLANSLCTDVGYWRRLRSKRERGIFVWRASKDGEACSTYLIISDMEDGRGDEVDSKRAVSAVGTEGEAGEEEGVPGWVPRPG